MAADHTELLPLRAFIAQLEGWQSEQSDARRAGLRASLERIVNAHGVRGALIDAYMPPMVPLDLGAGSLVNGTDSTPARTELVQRTLKVPRPHSGRARLWIDGADPEGIDRLSEAVELSLAAVWAKQEMLIQQRQLEALDLALQGIADIASTERVLQLIVDRVRDLVGAQYAALGVVNDFGLIEQFITSGVSPQVRARIGPLPRGHGLLGLIIHEDRSFLIDDIATDFRRYGFPPDHPEMHAFLGVPVHTKGRSVGNLYLTNRNGGGPFTEEDLALVARFARHAGIAIENARLQSELGRLAIVDERQRISQDLHDSVIQSLYAISLSLEDLPDVITEDPVEGAARADRAIDSIHGTIRDIRNFIMGLQPEMLNDLADLATGIRTLAAEFEANTLIDMELHLDELIVEPASDDVAQVLAITREGLSNVARHSRATRATIQLEVRGSDLYLAIGDNGRGFDVNEGRTSGHRGLTNLRSRAEAMGGTMTLSSKPGAGTRLELAIPTSGALSDESGSSGDQHKK